MKIYCRPRQSGKTLWFLEQANKTNAIIVCHNAQEAERLQRLAKELQYEIVPPRTYQEVLDGRLRGSTSSFLIDNVDMLLWQIFSCPHRSYNIDRHRG